jgi:hypothetical protein
MNMNIIECVDDAKLFQPWFAGRSWNTWRVALKAAYALPMTKTERTVLRTIAGREPPKKPVRECWFVCGRRAGKDSIASLIAGTRRRSSNRAAGCGEVSGRR